DDEARALRTLGDPLELVQLGQTRGSLRLDTRYIKTVRDMAQGESVLWDPIDVKLADTYGMTTLVRNFFLRLLPALESFRAVHAMTGEPLDELPIDNKSRSQIKLLRAPLLDLAEWSRAREIARELLKVEAASGTRNLSAQDRLAKELEGRATTVRQQLSGAHEHLVRLGLADAPRTKDLKEAQKRLAPLMVGQDSCTKLRHWLEHWPADASDPLRLVVLRAGTISEALAKLGDNLRRTLLEADEGALDGEVKSHLDALDALLSLREHERALDDKQVSTWNAGAQILVTRLVQATRSQPQPIPPDPPITTPPGAKRFQARARAGDDKGLTEIVDRIRQEAEPLGPDAEITVDVIIRPKKG
ncbi:MAG TPA: hypothetical protein VFB62_04340, partial [Polyangiaceae bacterium]|nr:hypothetical protein [Polyangiaceae bacterium]